MEKSSKRGKIPQQDWPLIMARYDSGETLASIARTYDCSPPAISYIVSRSRARNAATPSLHSAPQASEPQLVKAGGTEPVSAGVPHPQVPGREPLKPEAGAADPWADSRPSNAAQNGTAPHRGSRPPEPQGERRAGNGNGFRDEHGRGGLSGARNGAGLHGGPPLHTGVTNGAAPNGSAATPATDLRPKLHLALGGSSGESTASSRFHQGSGAAIAPVQHRGGAERGPFRNGGQGDEARGHMPVAPDHKMQAGGEPQNQRSGPSFIDEALRERVQGDIGAFLAAFDAALESDTQESRAGLREATDRLLRAGARTRIELERLEARVPLPQPAMPKDGSAWRR